MDAKDYYNRGVAYAKSGDYDKAIEDLTEVLRIDENYPSVKEILADYYNTRMNLEIKERENLIQDYEYGDGIREYSMALRFSPFNAPIFFNRGVRYLIMKRKENYVGVQSLAIADFERAIELNPHDADFYKALEDAKNAGGKPFREMGKLFEDIEKYTKSIQDRPDDAEKYFKRGLAFKELGNKTLAKVDYMIASKIKPENAQYKELSEKGTACYIATAVYGSSDCSQVWILRRYRDKVLAKTISGRAFINTYYSISPIILQLFGEFSWFTKLCRRKLDKLVHWLQEKGYKDTPYNDKEN